MPFLTVPEEQSVETPNRALQGYGIDAIPSSTGEVLGAVSGDTWARNPLPSSVRWLDRGRMRMNNKDVADLSADDANALYGVDDKQAPLKFDDPVPETTASQLSTLKREELLRRNVISRGQGGAWETAGKFAVGLGVSAIDPLNLASAFIPVVGEARFGLWAAKYGTTTARLARGGAEGLVGAAAVEPIVFGVAHQEQADYHLTDSLLNLTFGTAIGGGLHMGLGKLGDMIAGHQLQEPTLRGAVANLIDDRPVRVDQYLKDQFLNSTGRDLAPVIDPIRLEQDASGRFVQAAPAERPRAEAPRAVGDLIPEDIRAGGPVAAERPIDTTVRQAVYDEAKRRMDVAQGQLDDLTGRQDTAAAVRAGVSSTEEGRLKAGVAEASKTRSETLASIKAAREAQKQAEAEVARIDGRANVLRAGETPDEPMSAKLATLEKQLLAAQKKAADAAQIVENRKAADKAAKDHRDGAREQLTGFQRNFARRSEGDIDTLAGQVKGSKESLDLARQNLLNAQKAFEEQKAAATRQSQEALWRQVQEMSRIDYMTVAEKAEVAGIEDIVSRSASPPAKAGESASAADAGAIAEDLAHLEGIIAQMEKNGTAPDAVRAYREGSAADKSALAREKGIEAAANCQILRGAAA